VLQGKTGVTGAPTTALKIIATGIALPGEKIVSATLDRQLGKPEGYVERRSNILWRYHATAEASQAALAAEALHNALASASLVPSSIDLLICASAIAVQALPCSAIHILQAANMPAGVAGFDINSSCVSFISALEVAAGPLNIGAACAIVERGDGASGIVASLIEMYPDGSELCEIRAGGTRRNPRAGMTDSDFLFHMQGKRLFRFAASLIEDYFARLLQKSGSALDEIATVVPHQASHLSLEHMRKRLKVPEAVLVDIYRYYGNQVAASIPTALHEAVISGRFQPG